MKFLVNLSLIVVLIFSAFSSDAQTITVTANHGDTICAGTNMFFHASTTDTIGTHYKWMHNSTTVGGPMPFYGNNALVSGDTVYCELTNLAGDTVIAISNYHIITVLPSVHPSMIAGGDSVCVGGTLALMDSVAGGVWHSTNTSVFTVDSVTGLVTGIAPGVGMTRVVYTITTGNCPDSVRLRVRVNVPAGPLMGPTSSVCMDSVFRIRDTARGGTWTVANTTIASLLSPMGAFQALAPGTTQVYYTVANACGLFNDTLSVSVIDCSAGINNVSASAAGLQVYPNPNTGNFTIDYNATGSVTAMATITNLLGQQVRQLTITAGKETNISNMAPGMYFITVRAGDHSLVEKVVVE